jgi:peptidyl-prolyl cis-trans isomerase D
VNQERKIRYFILPYATVSNQSIQIPEEKIQAYYDSHQDEFKTPEQVSIEYIEFSMKDVINNIQPSEQELQDFYSDNQSLFVEPARWKLDSIVIPAPASFTPEELAAVKSKVNEIYEKAKTGESFAKLETEYLFQHAPNIDAKNWVTQNQIPAELQKVLATLKARDQVTEPMQTSQGFVILKAVDFINVSNQSFEQVKPKVIEKLKQQKAEEKFTDIREKLASSSYEHPESLQATSQLLNLPIKTTELFSQDKPGKDISANSKIREAAFSQDVLNLQNNSDVIQLTADSVAVIRVKSHELSALLPLKTVRAQIENQLTKSEVEEKTLQVAQDIIAKLKNNDSASQVLQEYKVKWNNVGWIARHATNVNPAILETAFNMQKTDQNNSVTYETTKLSEGYGIIALDEVKDGQLIDKDEYKVFAEQIQNTQGLLEYELYKQSVVDQAKIVAK